MSSGTVGLLFKIRADADVNPAKRAAAELRLSVAQNLANIRQTAAQNLAQTRSNVTQNLANIRENTAQTLARIRVQTAQELSEIRRRTSVTLSSIGSDLNNFGSQVLSAFTRIAAALTLLIVGLGTVSTKSALQLDEMRNKLVAIEGSVEAADRRIAVLRQTAQNSVGVTSRSAIEAYSQLSTIGDITEQTIERQIKAVGRLNAVFKIDDQQGFFRNVTQIFQQNFERADIKEALGRVPIFEQLLESAFGTRDPAKLKKLKESGKLTLDAFLAGLAGAVESDPRLQNIGESLGVRLQKTVERITVALAPIGRAILDAIEPYIEPTAQLIEKLSRAFESLPSSAQLSVVAFGALAAVAGPLLIAFGSVVSAVGAIAGALSGPVVVATVAVVGVFAQVAAAAGALYLAWQTNFGGIRDFTLEVYAAIREAVSAGLAFIGELWRRHGVEILGAALTVWNGVRSVVEGAVRAVVDLARENFQTLIDWVRENWPLIRQTIEAVLDGLIKSVRAALQLIQDFWTAHGEKITAVISGAWTVIKTTVGATLQVLLGTIRVALQLINADWRGAWETLASNGRAVNRAVEVVTSIIVAGLRAVGRMAYELAIEVGKQIVLGILQGIARMNPQTAIAAALIAAISGAGAQARAEAGLQGDAAARAYLAGFGGAMGLASVAGLAVGKIVDGDAPAKTAGGGGTAAKGKGKKSKDNAARFEGEALDRQEREAEAVHRRETERLQYEYDQRLISLRDYTNKQIEELGNWYNDQQALIAQREEFINRTVKDARERRSRLEALAQERRDLDDEMGRRSRAVNDEARKKEFEAEERHQRAIEKLEDERGERRIENLKEQAEAGLLARAEAERQIQEIVDAAFHRELNALNRELEAARANLEERQRITDEIAALNERRAASAEAASHRIADAILRESGPRPNLINPPADGPRVTETDEELFGDMGPPPPPDFSVWHQTFELLKKTGLDAFNGLAQGMGSMIQSFLTGGKAGAQSFAALAKAITASLAAQALVEAAMQVAHAFKEFALAAASAAHFDFRGAALHTAAAHAHLQAAVAFGIVGGVAAAASAAISAGGGGGGSASGGNGNQSPTYGETDRQRREREQAEKDKNTTRGERGTPLVIQSNLYMDGQQVGQTMRQVYLSDAGGFREVVVSDQRGGAGRI